MASPPPFQVEDNTDEDFFDKLVDDDCSGFDGSEQKSSEMARAFSNLSLGEVGASLEDSEVERKDLFATELSDSFPAGDEFESIGQLGKKTEEKAQADVMKGTSVKEVQWSAFSVGSELFGAGGFDSELDFLAENAGGSDDIMKKADAGLESSFMESPVENSDSQVYGSSNEQTVDQNDLQYWENRYPGWKYDASTGQWYQVDGYEMSTNNTQVDSYSVGSVTAQEAVEDKVQTSFGGAGSESSGISYLQQTSQSVLETIAEDSTVSSVSNWNQVSYGSAEYPPNMVFDPQYPDWYYDTNTQQWYTLESYIQAIQQTSNAVQEQVQQVANTSAGYSSAQNHNSYGDVGQVQQQGIQRQASQEFTESWDASTSNYAAQYHNLRTDIDQSQQTTTQGQGIQKFGGGWDASTSNFTQQNMWQPEPVGKSGHVAGFAGNHQGGSFYGATAGSHIDKNLGPKTFEPVVKNNYRDSNGVTGFQSFVPAESMYQLNQHKVEQTLQSHLSNSYYGNENPHYPQQYASYSQSSYAPVEERSSAGRPQHALVSFGFGGKLIIMKDANSFGTNFGYGSQGAVSGVVSILNLSEVVTDKTDTSSISSGDVRGYFHALCQQSFPGPLVGGSASAKDVNKWIEERITTCESSNMDYQKGEHLRLLLSLLKILCQHYGKVRSPFGANPSVEETDGPELAVTKLFASARKNGTQLTEYGSVTHCTQNLPSEGQLRATAVEVQSLLVSGRRREALQYAQEGQLWGPALVLAAQLGDEFYVDTVKKMAHRQFICGSPLRTLCLLIAGQPADVFVDDSSANSLSGAVYAPRHSSEIPAKSMLDNWEENLAIIAANRTKEDHLVMLHLGDSLLKQRGEVTAAHNCYLVAEENFMSYSDTARLCLIGANHWTCPRTYASPEAIQRTELYEYSKVLGNSQIVLLPFQPYKLIYAYMLAEVGKINDSLRYCQASLKLLKNSGRTPEVEMWKTQLSSLEERLRTHQQGGYSTNLAPAKLVGKLFTSLDRSLHRMIGAPPAPLPPMPQSNGNGRDNFTMAPKVATSQSTMAMSSLMPSASVEAISEWSGDSTRKSIHNRSISEPDFGRSPKQGAGSPDAQSKASITGGPSRFGRIGSQLLQKTMGWVARSRPDRQAKLGEQNKFYYDEKLKRWVEEGAEPPAEEAALPPPPKAATFQNGTTDYSINSAFKNQNLISNGGPGTKSSTPLEHNSGTPPIPPSQNQFSARSRMGVRSRYVDTFNKGGGTSLNSFQSPSAPSVKPTVGAKFFVPMAPAISGQADAMGESVQEASISGEPSTSLVKDASFSPPSASSSSSMQRFPSMDNIAPYGNQGSATALSGNGPFPRTRAASWSGTYADLSDPKLSGFGDGLGVASPFVPNMSPSIQSSSSASVQQNGGSLGDDLHEVEL